MKRNSTPSTLARLRRAAFLQAAALAILLPSLVFLPGQIRANPSGGVVTHGDALIDLTNPAHLKVFQGSNRAIINWRDFSISAGEITEFVQPGRNAMALSRVVGGNPSAIYGTLRANGGHILVNPNGIVVGPGGVVDVGGLNVLSTLDIDDANFMGGGDLRFFGNTSAGVTNFGTITSADGDVVLLGNFVDNQGSIGAINGTVALGAGGEILLHQNGDQKISILRGGAGGQVGVNNDGQITGAAVEMKAHGNVYALAVNNGPNGQVRATGANRVNGRVILSAPNGVIRNSGSIRANNADGSGGIINIEAPGGEVQLQGGEVRADGIGNTDGGSITVDANVIGIDGGAVVSASGVNGGAIQIGSPATSSVHVGNAQVRADGSGGNGGAVGVTGNFINVDPTAVISASGEVNGGSIDLQGGGVNAAGALEATGGTGAGGAVRIGGQTVNQEFGGRIDTGGREAGGRIELDGATSARIAGDLSAASSEGTGGVIHVTGDQVEMALLARADATGATGGGQVNIGGGFQGNDPNLRNASNTRVGSEVKLRADSTGSGHGGRVVIWADGSTLFEGEATARALGATGNGGTIEVSGREELLMRGSVAANSFGGSPGAVLFDPGDVVVGNAGSTIPVATINAVLQGGTSVIIATHDGNITFANLGGGGDDHAGAEQVNPDVAIQWTNSEASFGAFAFKNIIVNNHIRTSGAGSINLIAGWTGSENSLTPDPGGQPYFAGSPEDLWEQFVELGAFGFGNASIILQDNARQVEVGSRYGNTNVATGNLFMLASTANGESRGVHLGFRDSGQVFTTRRNMGDGFDIDLNNNTWGADDAPLVGILGQYEADVYTLTATGTLVAGPDGIPDGVRGIDHTGVLYDTFIPYANLFNSARSGNWWWQQIHGRAITPGNYAYNAAYATRVAAGTELGGNRPEMGAGISSSQRADINVAATGQVYLQGGDRNRSYAQIGHGGDSSGDYDNISRRNGAGLSRNGAVQTLQYWSFNGADVDRSGKAIARLAPIYGNINVLAGVDASTVQYDRTAQTRNLAGDVTGAGGITLQGSQRMGAANDPNNPENNGHAQAGTQIGHGGTGQFGEFYGDIYLRSGGDVIVRAGAGTRSSALIGHGTSGYAYWKPASNIDSQIRFFKNQDDFDNPNLRRGQLYKYDDPADGLAIALEPSGYAVGNNVITIDSGTTAPIAGDTVTFAGHATVYTVSNVVGNRIVLSQTLTAPVADNETMTFTGTGSSDWQANRPGGTARSDPDFIIANPIDLLDNLGNAMGGLPDANTDTDGETNFATANALATGDGVDLPKNAVGPNDADHPVIDAIGGVVENIWAGDIVVESNGPNGVVLKAFDTPDTRDPNYVLGAPGSLERNGIVSRRDRRFAMIGHGGALFPAGTERFGVIINRTDRDQEFVQSRIDNTSSWPTSFARSESGNRLNNSMTWLTLQGDITIDANNGGVLVQAGNNVRDFAMIGHGGSEIAEFQTAGLINGDITIRGAGDLVLKGGGEIPYTGMIYNASLTSEWHNFAQVGHGGYRPLIQSFTGDISITMGGDISLTSGTTAYSHAQIGHQGAEAYGQSGGDFSRFENFWFDSWTTDTTTSLNANGATLTMQTSLVGRDPSTPMAGTTLGTSGSRLSVQNRTLDFEGVTYRDNFVNPAYIASTEDKVTYEFADGGGSKTVGANPAADNAYLRWSGNTANIEVAGEGNLTMDHLPARGQQTDNEYVHVADPNNDGGNDDTLRTDWSWTLIGHGGRQVDAFTAANAAYRFDDKVGDILVDIGGNIVMKSGNRQEYWTAIGHRGSNDDDDSRPGFGSLGMEMGGTITVNAGGSLTMDALGDPIAFDFANGELRNFLNEQDIHPDGLTSANGRFNTLNPTQINQVVIGHGVAWNGLYVYAIDGGTIAGIATESDIVVDVGTDLKLQGGSGYRASFAQIGHGYPEETGDTNNRAGFAGDITVNVGNNLDLVASPNGWVPTPIFSLSSVEPIDGASAVIGHGGNFLDAPASGNISVYVGNNLTMHGSQRKTEGFGGEGFGDNGTQPLGSYASIAKIGHWSTEFDTANWDDVDANHSGDITVVVNNNLEMRGGKTQNFGVYDPFQGFPGRLDEPVILGVSQIGHGFAGVGGNQLGEITVLVNNDLTTVDGTIGYLTTGRFVDGDLAYDLTTTPGRRTRSLDRVNNYAMIGNGGWLREVPLITGAGSRGGDISVAAGRNIFFDHTLVGHADPVAEPDVTRALYGVTTVAAGRNFPFYDGSGATGYLRAVNNSVFASALQGGTELRFYVGDRESNQLNYDLVNPGFAPFAIGISDDPNLGATRVNTSTYAGVAGGGVSFASDANHTFDVSQGQFAGAADEIYLQPDLWWSATDADTAIGPRRTFPASLNDVQGGSIATVTATGGLPNLVALSAGDLGSGTATYPNLAKYAIYYDAIQAPPPPPPPPPPVFITTVEQVSATELLSFLAFLFDLDDKFDAYDRFDRYLEGYAEEDDAGVYARLFGTDEESEDDEVSEENEEERKSARYRRLTQLYGIFYQVSLDGGYSSNALFGLPGLEDFLGQFDAAQTVVE